MIAIKDILLAKGFIDNVYLDKYVDIISVNETSKNADIQKHHVIPICCYGIRNKTNRSDNIKIAEKDPDNYMVTLSRFNHIRAHYYLCKCSNNVNIGPLTAALSFIVYGSSNSHTYTSLTEIIKSVDFDEDEFLKTLADGFKRSRSCYVTCIETQETLYIAEASKKYGRSEDCILSNCRGWTSTCGGYHWAKSTDIERQNRLKEFIRKDPEDPENINIRKSKKQSKYSCYCVELDINFDSMVDAGKYIKKLRKSSADYRTFARMIICATNGRYKTAYGYHWIRKEKN